MQEGSSYRLDLVVGRDSGQFRIAAPEAEALLTPVDYYGEFCAAYFTRRDGHIMPTTLRSSDLRVCSQEDISQVLEGLARSASHAQASEFCCAKDVLRDSLQDYFTSLKSAEELGKMFFTFLGHFERLNQEHGLQHLGPNFLTLFEAAMYEFREGIIKREKGGDCSRNELVIATFGYVSLVARAYIRKNGIACAPGALKSYTGRLFRGTNHVKEDFLIVPSEGNSLDSIASDISGISGTELTREGVHEYLAKLL